jgi:hypothetical protein
MEPYKLFYIKCLYTIILSVSKIILYIKKFVYYQKICLKKYYYKKFVYTLYTLIISPFHTFRRGGGVLALALYASTLVCVSGLKILLKNSKNTKTKSLNTSNQTMTTKSKIYYLILIYILWCGYG